MIDVPNDGILNFRGLFNQDRLLVTNPKALSEILVGHPYDFEKPLKTRLFLRRILGDGLIIVEGDIHKFQRKNVMPVFSFRHLKELYPMMWTKAVTLTQAVAGELREQPGNSSMGEKIPSVEGVLEVNHWANKVTMDIIGVAAMGRELHALQNDDDELIRTYEEILEPTTEKLIYFATQIIGPQELINKLPWGINERVNVTTATLRRICTDLVQEKREAIKADADSHLDILSVLIKSDNFSNAELVDQMLTFLAAGYDFIEAHLVESLLNLLPGTRQPHRPLHGRPSSLPSIPNGRRSYARKLRSSCLTVQYQKAPMSFLASSRACQFSTVFARKFCACILPFQALSACHPGTPCS